MSKFKPGQSGNPNGRPKGSGQAGKLRQAIADDLPEVIQALTEQAKAGDVNAAKILLDRCLPVLKPIEAPVQAPGIDNGKQSERADKLLAMVADGEINADQALHLLGAVQAVETIRSAENRPSFDLDWNLGTSA